MASLRPGFPHPPGPAEAAARPRRADDLPPPASVSRLGTARRPRAHPSPSPSMSPAPRYQRSTSSSAAHAQASGGPHYTHMPAAPRDRERDRERDRGPTASPAKLPLARKDQAATATTIYPELDRYRAVRNDTGGGAGPAHPDILFRLATEHRPTPPPPPPSSSAAHSFSGVSGSPSTRFSESPGPGPYSRDTTPTSMSSQSPGLAASVRMPSAPRMMPRAPLLPPHPPALRGRTGSFGKEAAAAAGNSPEGGPPPPVPGPLPLAAIREALNSSSSSSNGTVRGTPRDKKPVKKKRLAPPSPPPRTSSHRRFRPSSDDDDADADADVDADDDGNGHRIARRPSSRPRTHAAAPAPAAAPALPVSQRSASQRPAAAPPPASQRPSIAPSGLPKHPRPPARPPLRPPAGPPARPSRDGTPDLQLQLAPALPVVIQSNLAATALSDRRTSLHAGPAPPSRSEPPRPPSASASAPAPDAGSEPRKIVRTPSPSVSTFRTRFPLFSRRANKTAAADAAPAAPAAAAPVADKREARKGPAAGTGHEGYGRLGGAASRRRSSSVSTFLRGSGGGTASSQESLVAGSSPPFRDPFLRDRLSPVVIAGGEVVANQNTGYFDSGHRRPSTDSQADSQASSSRDGHTTLWPSAIPRSGASSAAAAAAAAAASPQETSRSRSRSRRPSDSSDSEAVMRSTLAFRRSVQRLRSPDRAPLRVPKPIVVHSSSRGGGGPPSSAMTSHDTSILTETDSLPDARRDASAAPPAQKKKLTKRARSPRRWNLFGRSQSQPASAKKALLPPSQVQSTSTVAVTVQAAEKPRPVAFYAMLDASEQEDGDVDLLDVEDVLREARVLGSPASVGRSSADGGGRGGTASRASSRSRLASPPPPPPPPPQPPVARRPSVAAARQHHHHHPGREQASQAPPPAPPQAPPAPSAPLVPPATRAGRPSRLPQVGRIPKVVSARPDQTTSPMSFSRPFHRTSQPLLPPAQSPLWTAGPTPPAPPTPELLHDGSTATGSSADPWSSSVARSRLSHTFTPDLDAADGSGHAFLSLAPRKDSQTTTTSSASSTGLFRFADATAVVPGPSAPLVEDEIWDEYNDLLGDDAAKVPPSAGSSQGLPFHLEMAAAATTRPNRLKAAAAAAADTLESPTIAFGPTAPDEQRLSQLPETPFSVSEFVSGYGDRNSSGTAADSRSPRQPPPASPPAPPPAARVSDGSVYSQVSEDNSPLSQVNLRVGSMTVSKWLTFGHVLFSPARDDLVLAVSPPNGHSVLVIDGLGNDDWSFYAAETYPAATFFNLSPRAPLPAAGTSAAGSPSSAFPLSPPNHHQVQYTSHADRLPFQSEIFTTVVYRFPAAAPEAHYRNIVHEARRVLKPGGYLELAVLDLDLNNMGHRTRRAMRRLKEQMHARAPDLHLGSTADLVLRLLGTRGFTDIKSCRVGIPVASPLPQPSSGGNSSEVEAPKRASPPPPHHPLPVPPPSSASASASAASSTAAAAKPKRDPRKDQRSLAEMIHDEGPLADESITNMVARVGRWWHSRCYGGAGGPGHSDMWTNRTLLAECDAWRTNLKLLVCYARVPDSKRVASI